MDIGYKLERLRRWSEAIGMRAALGFELQQSLRQPVIAFQVPALNRTVYLRAHTSDVSVFEEVFIASEFAVSLPRAPRVIVDAGANCGLVSLFFAWRYPEARIIAVEPSADNIAMMRRNLAGIGGIDIVQSAVWSEPAWLRIANPEAHGWAYRCTTCAPDAPGAFWATDVATLLDERGLTGCDLLKLDVEGAETEIFAAADRWRDRTDAVLVEVHSEGAMREMKRAFPEDAWTSRWAGEKTLLTRNRKAEPDPQRAGTEAAPA